MRKFSNKKKRSSFLKVSKYENPSAALELIAHICSAAEHPTLISGLETSRTLIDDFSNNRSESMEDSQGLLYDLFEDSDIADEILDSSLFVDDLSDQLQELQQTLTSNILFSLNIAVAGGYSAGKSSFLNAFTGLGSLLPTGIEPVSVVNTFITCLSDNQEIKVLGENYKGNLVSLDTEVLSCIQHSSTSKVYIATVLEKLILEVPAHKSFLDGITFIDTPGYNNSHNVNDENNKTDHDTAQESLKIADIVIWCIDIEGGCITNNDFNVLKNIGDKPILVVFTKSDKKPKDEIQNILKKAYSDFTNNMGCDPVDIIAFSAREDEAIFLKSQSFSSVFSALRKETGKTNCWEYHQSLLKEKRDTFNRGREDLLKRIEQKRIDLADQKRRDTDAFDAMETTYRNREESTSILISQTKQLMAFYSYLCNCFLPTYDEIMTNVFDREYRWSAAKSFFSDTESILKDREESIAQLEQCIAEFQKEHNLVTIDPNDEVVVEQFDDLQKFVLGNTRFHLSSIEKSREEIQQGYKGVLDLISYVRDDNNAINTLVMRLLTTLDQIKEECKKEQQSQRLQIKKIKTDEVEYSIFEAISRDDMKLFLDAFSKGVNLEECNVEGFNPITWAVKSGNNEMIKFLQTHKVDFSIRDNNGLNALDVAVQCHFQDICELLLTYDPDLLHASTDLIDRANQNTFTEWLRATIQPQ